jgi:hypothetical protein
MLQRCLASRPPSNGAETLPHRAKDVKRCGEHVGQHQSLQRALALTQWPVRRTNPIPASSAVSESITSNELMRSTMQELRVDPEIA